MRKTLGLALAAALALGALGAPAGAGKTVTKKKKFSAGPHAPMPTGILGETEGCLESVEGLNKTTVGYHTPKKGTFTAKIFNFEGDWDMYVTDKRGAVLGSSHASQLEGAPPTEKVVLTRVPAKEHLEVVVCNWAGLTPTADGLITFKYRR
jgi:hypothetical protein